MTYKIIPWSPDLDLSEFYSEAGRRGYENNHSQKTMFDCFLNEREWAGWMLEYNGKFIGGVCIHSFDDVMGPNTYRILARTCTFTSETHKPWPHTKQTIIVEQQCCATQFFIPISIQWAGEGKRFFATSNANPMGSQQRVNNLWFPMQAELGRFSWVKETIKDAIGTKSEFVKVDDKNRFYYMLQQMQNNRWKITVIVLFLFFFIIAGINSAVFFGIAIQESWKEMLLILLGAFVGNLNKVVDYWFNSEDRDKMLIQKVDEEDGTSLSNTMDVNGGL